MQVFISVSSVVVSAFVGIAFVAILGVFLRTNELPSRLVRWGLFGTVALLVTRGIVYSIVQYQAFQTGLLKFLSSWELFVYAVRYSLLHYFSSMLLSMFVGGALLLVFWILQRRSQGKWLDTNERLLVTFGALAAGWPGAILYAVGVFFLPLIVTPWLVRNVHVHRVRLAPFIVLSALIAIVITPFLLPVAPWLQVLTCRTCI